MTVSNAEIFRTYLERFTSGDRAGAAELLTDDYTARLAALMPAA